MYAHVECVVVILLYPRHFVVSCSWPLYNNEFFLIVLDSSHFTFYPGELLPEPSGPINPLRFLIPGPLKVSLFKVTL